MCGIVAYVGDRACAPLLLDGLRKLEYRGYDSAGLAVHSGRSVVIARAVGKLHNLDAALAKAPLAGTVGIGHTRWATHGRPSESNAHPHIAGGVAVVHNGIIENHVALRRELENKGVRFASDTDTEIVAHLVDDALKSGQPDLESAVRAALARVKGAYAIAVVSSDAPDRVVVAKNESPIVFTSRPWCLGRTERSIRLCSSRRCIAALSFLCAVAVKPTRSVNIIAASFLSSGNREIDWNWNHKSTFLCRPRRGAGLD